MLDFMRRQHKHLKWVWVILIFIFSVTLVTLYIPFGDLPTVALGNNVADVGAEAVSSKEFQTAYRNYLNQMQQQLTPEILRAFRFDRQVLDYLITQKVVSAEAKRIGLNVSPSELERTILTNPVFLENGKFIGLDRYQQLLSANNLTVPEFEDSLRTQLLNSKLRDFVTAGVTVADADVEQEYRKRTEKAKLDYFVINPTDLEKTVTLSDQDLRTYYDKNKAQYTIPEKRKGKYIYLENLKFRQQAAATDQELQDYFAQHQEEYRLPEQITAQHILFKTTGKTPEEVEKIREKARGVLDRVKKGEDFGALAKQFSEDSTASNGGDLGSFRRGTMVPEFEQVAFSLGAGAVSELVTTQFGIHIIKVNSKQEARLRPFEELKEAIRSIVNSQKADQKANEVAQQVSTELAKNSDMNAVAQKFGAGYAETPLLEQGKAQPLAGMGDSLPFITRLFMMSKGEIGASVKVDQGYVIPQVTDVQAPHPASYDEAKERVGNDARLEKAQELATEKANQIQEQVKAGKDLSAIAKAMGGTIKTSEFITRTGSIPDFGGIAEQEKEIFSLPIGKTGTPARLGGKTMVFSVKERQDINPDELKKAADALHKELLNTKREQYFNAYILEVKKKMQDSKQIEVNESILASLGQVS